MKCRSLALLATLALLASLGQALRTKLHLSGDNRAVFSVETFGFLEGGVADISVSSIAAPGALHAGFLLRKVLHLFLGP